MTYEMARFIEWLSEPFSCGIPDYLLRRTGDTNNDNFMTSWVDVSWKAFLAGYELRDSER